MKNFRKCGTLTNYNPPKSGALWAYAIHPGITQKPDTYFTDWK